MTQYPPTPDDRFGISLPTSELSLLFPARQAERNPQGKVYFIVVLRGRAMLEIDGKEQLLQTRTFLFLTPGHLLRRLSQSDDFLFRYLFFDFDFLSDFPLLLKPEISNRATIRPCIRVDAATFNMIKRYYDFIADRSTVSLNRTEVTKGLLFSFILEVSGLYADREVSVKMSRQDELTEGFFSLLHRYCKEERTAAFYAGKLCVTDKHLMRSIKKQTGETFRFWMTDFVVREAKLLLKSTDKSIQEITEELHFPNSSFFARFFRRHTGLSPLQFREGKGIQLPCS